MNDLAALSRCFARIGLLSFGGPAAQIALMHREVVDRRKWISEQDYLSALSFCMLLPGPEAMQLATWIGWRKHGVLGGLIAGGLFVLPGAIIILALAMVYAAFGGLTWVSGLFLGIQSAVLVLVIEALLRISKRSLTQRWTWAVAVAAFCGLYLFQLPFPVIIALAAGLGAKMAPQTPPLPIPDLPWRQSGQAALIWGAIWLGPLGAIVLFGSDFLAQIAVFFSQLAVFTFGGAYAVLAWLTAEVVTQKEWITAPQMLAALGLAETTPGPLILVTQFVAYLAGYGQGGVALGGAAALVALWMTFAPCFLWIFAGAPWIAHLRSNPRIAGALTGIMAAVVGVIAQVSLWFGLHVFFAHQWQIEFGLLRPLVPDLMTIQPLPVAIALLASYLLLHKQWSLPVVLMICALTSASWTLL